MFSEWLTLSDEEMFRRPNGSQTSMVCALEVIISGDQLSLDEKQNLLFRAMLAHSSRCPELVQGQRSEITRSQQLIATLKLQHPWLMSAVFGNGYPELFVQIFRLVRADATSVQEYACIHDYVRPLVYHGYLLCPVCDQAEHLQAGIRSIIGFRGDMNRISQTADCLYRPLSDQVNTEMLRDLNEILISPVPDAERFVDHLLLVMDHTGRIPVYLHPDTQVSAATRQMVQEFSNRINT